MLTRLLVAVLLTAVAHSAFALGACTKQTQPEFDATTYYAPAAGYPDTLLE